MRAPPAVFTSIVGSTKSTFGDPRTIVARPAPTPRNCNANPSNAAASAASHAWVGYAEPKMEHEGALLTPLRLARSFFKFTKHGARKKGHWKRMANSIPTSILSYLFSAWAKMGGGPGGGSIPRS